MFNGSYGHYERVQDIETVLSTWNRNKERLFKIFGNKLILTKPFSYNKPENEIERDIDDMKYRSNDSKYGERKPRLFYEKFISFANEFSWKRQYEIRDHLYGLISSYGLKNNIYSGTTFHIETPDGKIIAIERGCKATKALGKIAKAFDIPYFEDFRICHSQILNQKTIEGTLTLSIHPLDYMTMSDNSNGWSSCMSWSSYGCYRQGTVEMLNSPNVVVAYLSDKNMTLPDGEKWNSKKWRSLIVADERVITHIKNYPYDNKDLSQFAVEWLKELTTEVTGNTYYESRFYNEISSIDLPNLPFFDVFTITGHMYNDFNSSDIGHCMAFSSQLTIEDLKKQFGKTCLTLEYSGPSMCMCCGAIDIDCDTENLLACDNCEHILYCAHCDDEINGDPYWVNGDPYCHYCYTEHIQACYECETEGHDSEMLCLSFVRRDSKEWEEKIREEYSWLRRANFEKNEKIICYQPNDNQVFCSSECLKRFVARECVPGTRIKTAYNTSSDYDFYFVYIDELTHSAKRYLFGVSDEKEYYSELEDYGTLSILSDVDFFRR